MYLIFRILKPSMKVTVLQENLVKALVVGSRVVSGKPQMPILSHILLRAGGEGLELQATNLDIGWKTVIGAKVDAEGEITVPVKTLLELVNNLGSGKLELLAEASVLKVLGHGFKSSVNGTVADEFPQLPVYKEEKAARLKSESLKPAIAQSVFACAADESRPVLTAVLARLSNKSWELVGTDGFRLSVVKGAQESELVTAELLIPAKSLLELSRLIEEGEKEVGFYMVEGGTQVIFKIGETELSTRLVSGNYPDYKKIMPESGETVVEMDKEELHRAMKLASVFARESANIVKLDIDAVRVMVSANAPQVGDNEVVVDAKVTGAGGKIAFNYKYVLDYLNAVMGNTVVLHFSGSLAAGLWKEEGKSTLNEFVHVIMPVRVEE